MKKKKKDEKAPVMMGLWTVRKQEWLDGSERETARR